MNSTTTALKLRIILEIHRGKQTEEYSLKYTKVQVLNNKHAMTLRMTSLKKTCGATLKEK